MADKRPLIALLTDFGSQDWFAATMKGVILSINPDVRIVDVTHEIAHGDITSAAFALKQCTDYFGDSTIFVVVVDPGVGSARAPLAVKAGKKFFIAPDNGVLTRVLAAAEISVIRRIENRKFCLPSVSNTFHGRDVFAPAAARLSLGKAFHTVGPVLEQVQKLALPSVSARNRILTGEVLYIDRFGNLITNITPEKIKLLGGGPVKLAFKKNTRIPYCNYYGQVDPGRPLGVIGSCGTLEISINGGNACRAFEGRVRDKVRVRAG